VAAASWPRRPSRGPLPKEVAAAAPVATQQARSQRLGPGAQPAANQTTQQQPGRAGGTTRCPTQPLALRCACQRVGMDSTTAPWALAPCSAATTVPSLRCRADVLRSRTGLSTSKLPACTRQESGDKCMALHRIARMLRHGDPSPCRLQTVLDVGYLRHCCL
jgi:hypothetical protein